MIKFDGNHHHPLTLEYLKSYNYTLMDSTRAIEPPRTDVLPSTQCDENHSCSLYTICQRIAAGATRTMEPLPDRAEDTVSKGGKEGNVYLYNMFIEFPFSSGGQQNIYKQYTKQNAHNIRHVKALAHPPTHYSRKPPAHNR